MHTRESLKLLAQEITASSQRVLQYTKNRSGTGLHRERLVESFIRKFAPSGIAFGSGFIYSEKEVSLQVDILGYDRENFGPIYDEGGYVVVNPFSVISVIEVKSVLNNNSLKDAFQNVISCTKINKNIQGSIFAFDGLSSEKTFDHMEDMLKSSDLGISEIDQFPDAILCLNKWVILKAEIDNKKCRYTYPKQQTFEEQFATYLQYLYYKMYSYRRALYKESSLPLLKEMGYQLVFDQGEVEYIDIKIP